MPKMFAASRGASSLCKAHLRRLHRIYRMDSLNQYVLIRHKELNAGVTLGRIQLECTLSFDREEYFHEARADISFRGLCLVHRQWSPDFQDHSSSRSASGHYH